MRCASGPTCRSRDDLERAAEHYMACFERAGRTSRARRAAFSTRTLDRQPGTAARPQARPSALPHGLDGHLPARHLTRSPASRRAIAPTTTPGPAAHRVARGVGLEPGNSGAPALALRGIPGLRFRPLARPLPQLHELRPALAGARGLRFQARALWALASWGGALQDASCHSLAGGCSSTACAPWASLLPLGPGRSASWRYEYLSRLSGTGWCEADSGALD